MQIKHHLFVYKMFVLSILYTYKYALVKGLTEVKEFNYTIKDEVGLHARPAGLLVKTAGGFSSEITVSKGEKSADAKKLFALMGLGIKCGDTVAVSIQGGDEDGAYDTLKNFFESNL